MYLCAYTFLVWSTTETSGIFLWVSTWSPYNSVYNSTNNMSISVYMFNTHVCNFYTDLSPTMNIRFGGQRFDSCVNLIWSYLRLGLCGH